MIFIVKDVDGDTVELNLSNDTFSSAIQFGKLDSIRISIHGQHSADISPETWALIKSHPTMMNKFVDLRTN